MMKCGACGANGFRVRQEEGRAIYTCRACSAVTAKHEATHPPVEHEDDALDNAHVRKLASQKSSPAKSAINSRPASKPIDVLKLAKARLREVERELRTKQKLEAERDELKRIISAASGKPGVVRSIRTAV